MNSKFILKSGTIINEGKKIIADILINGERIERIDSNISDQTATEINCEGKFILPGIIDDQVHFREPGLTHKGNIYSESRAAVAGGTTSFMEMPNVNPLTITQDLLSEKYAIGSKKSLANYSFFMGTTNNNIEEVLKTNPNEVCGVKIFMGSSTGDMLVDNENTLRALFSKVPILIAAHCENETMIKNNTSSYRALYGENIPFDFHPIIRNAEACFSSSSFAISLAKEYNTRFHVLHISTKEECDLFTNDIPLSEKRITAEACVHHLFFDAADYGKLGSRIKCNPAIKEKSNKAAIFKALLDDKIDIIATDHAPHTWEEKSNPYFNAPAGLPLVQHSLNIMLDFYFKNQITLEKIVEKMCHAPAICFQVKERGFVKEGFFADLIVVDLEKKWTIDKKNILYHCGWSPLEGLETKGAVLQTFVSGHLAYNEGVFNESKMGQRLLFNRN
ncbi:MAG: dihydroorotase [Bacteroidetes bacterium]|nr:dihydroorotase [Bacteroidota bacterium]MBP7257468.1 dihydroorotase [Chitinophagales bacterium]MBK7505798.1 dihydroorotase [Bacteroidota bacterium]MBK7639928.1 dihydroorotase [Bacteroidota bacterium]MBK8671730.1 dihydroorotase [Bacteroidota bacterium]